MTTIPTSFCTANATIGKLRLTLEIDLARSQVSQHELESIYNIDSMTEEDFLKYNYSQLLKIAIGENSKEKRWMGTYLKTCGNSPEKRRLTQHLVAD